MNHNSFIDVVLFPRVSIRVSDLQRERMWTFRTHAAALRCTSAFSTAITLSPVNFSAPTPTSTWRFVETAKTLADTWTRCRVVTLNSESLLHSQDEDGFTPVLLAAWDPWKRGTLPTLTHLALIGANLDVPDNEGTPPILKAWNQPQHVATLVQHGCNVNTVTKHGFSLVELAAMQNDFDLAAALLSAGAQPPKPVIFSEPRTKYRTEYSILRMMCSSPLTLKEQSRLCIRKIAHKCGTVYRVVERLPLPLLIKNYLMMTEIPLHPDRELVCVSVREN